jgi:hypothetical protein
MLLKNLTNPQRLKGILLAIVGFIGMVVLCQGINTLFENTPEARATIMARTQKAQEANFQAMPTSTPMATMTAMATMTVMATITVMPSMTPTITATATRTVTPTVTPPTPIPATPTATLTPTKINKGG